MISQPDRAFAPLVVPAFRRLWIATAAAHTGYWAQSVAIAWWLVEQKYGPQVVALAHVSASLPVLLLSYGSGWLIDRFDYLRVQRTAQGWILFTSVALLALMCTDSPSPHELLLLTGLMGAGVALRNPAWQAGIGQIVPLRHLSAAIVLSSVAFNLARTLGPLIAGVLISVWGVWSAFLYNAVTTCFLFALLRRPCTHQATTPPSGMIALAPISPRSRDWLGRLCLRAIGIGLPTSALPALLPLVASPAQKDPHAYVGLLGAFGGGGLVAAMIRPRLIRILSPDHLLNICSTIFAACLLVVTWRPYGHLFVPVAVAGAMWLTLFSTLNVAVHSHSESSYRGRALAAYMTSAFGGMAAGGLLWGWVAELRDCDTSMVIAAAVLFCGLVFYRPCICKGPR